VAKLGESHAENRVEIRKDNQANGLRLLADLGGKFEHVLKRSFVLKGALAGALDNGSIGDRIAEWDAKLDSARARFDGGEDHVARGGEIGIAAGDVGDEGGFRFEVEGHEGLDHFLLDQPYARWGWNIEVQKHH
jgi:hypothetical protein